MQGSGQNETWEVYVVRAGNGALYTGIARDADRRFTDHANGRGAKFFRVSAAREIVYRETHGSRRDAQKREAEIKGMRRADKLVLIGKRGRGRKHQPRADSF